MSSDTRIPAAQFVNSLVSENPVVVFIKTWCPYCVRVVNLFNQEKIDHKSIELDLFTDGYGDQIQEALYEKTKQKTVPNVFINGVHVGGCTDVENAHKSGKLSAMLDKSLPTYDYDTVVIGGGSGGLAAAKAMAKLGLKVALCDFVTPSPQGTVWGLGGTCVNVGCIPKKLMHRAALIHEDMKDAPAFGWKIDPDKIPHEWNTMVSSVQSYIHSLNWNYKKDLRQLGVTYLNAFAKFLDKNTLQVTDKSGTVKKITAKNTIISVGCRPNYPEIPGGKEYALSSDDLFSLPHNPGKTLVVGASYVALECACFLKGINYETTVMVRSILLRGFDRTMAEKIGANMIKKGICFVNECVLTSIELVHEADGTTPPLLKVHGKFVNGDVFSDTFNTVLIAIGRTPCTDKLGLENAGIKVTMDGKIKVKDNDETSVPNIYAIGDVCEGRPELTPVAILAGKLLAKRLAQNTNTPLMDYSNIPSTVFTSLEYGCVGASEELATAMHGEKVVVYHDVYNPLENVLNEESAKCYAKLVCVKQEDGKEKVIGLHVLGPNAGEITQGFALAVKIGVTKEDFDNLVGIHPTCAEVFTTLTVTTSSGEELSDSKGC